MCKRYEEMIPRTLITLTSKPSLFKYQIQQENEFDNIVVVDGSSTNPNTMHSSLESPRRSPGKDALLIPKTPSSRGMTPLKSEQWARSLSTSSDLPT
ncbi:hypothetical protein PILCRDRAFT_139019 [Piloderma croceum F 1598]|uniref:Uncharacterized protein n=1 Tax=Piloderma croceum (strain F 1598) TaxID=765440 RepID=A0A0C3GMM4_PILCF|nr:hypothetical protein PILCRDRAFT_139019 [Piloderma croceum F 1598]